MKRSGVACAVTAVACTAFGACRASAAGDGPTIQLPDLVVTASRGPQPLADAPGSVSVITQQQIQDSGAREVDDVLRSVPGIDVLGYSGETQHPTSNSLGMRGLGGGAQGISRALVMVDGVPINDPFFGYIQWARVPIDDIDRIEVVRGGGSPLWGNYAEGGIINIITKQPGADHLTLTSGGGNWGTYDTSLSGSYRLNDENALQGFLGFNGTHGYQAVPYFERAPFNVPTSSDAVNVHVRDTFTPTNDTTAHLSVDYHNFRQQLQTVIDSNAQEYVNVAGDIQKRFDGGSSLTTALFYNHSNFRTNNSTYFPDEFDLAATTQSLNEIHNVTAQNAGGSLIWSQPVNGWLKSYKLGVDFQYIDGHDHADHFIAPDFSPTFFQTQGGGDQLFVGTFVQATFAPIEPLEVSVSGRLQVLNNTGGFDGSLGGFGPVPNQTYTSFDPRIDVRYRLPGGFTLRGAAYESFRAPNLGDQFYTYAAGGFVQLPNPLLKPETLVGGEIGFDYTGQRLRTQFTLYRTTVRDYIVAEATTNPVYSPQGWFVVQNQNIAKVLAQGVEAQVDYDFGQGFIGRLDYRLADSAPLKNPADPGSVGKQIIDVPLHTISAGLSYLAPKGWRVAVLGTYMTPTAWASPDHTYPGYPGKTSADAHFVLNASGSYPITPSIEAFVQVQNLLDRWYVVTSYSAPSAQSFGTPFSVFAGIRVTLDRTTFAR